MQWFNKTKGASITFRLVYDQYIIDNILITVNYLCMYEGLLMLLSAVLIILLYDGYMVFVIAFSGLLVFYYMRKQEQCISELTILSSA